MEFSRSSTRNWFAMFDWPLFLMTLVLAMMGVVAIYSATFASEGEQMRGLYLKQLEWNLYGLIILAIFSIMDYRNIERPAYLIYILTVFLLILVIFEGRVVSGSRRWLVIGGINFQPSEMMKLVLIVTLTKYYNAMKESAQELGFKQLFIPALITIIPAALIARQPDLGTAVVLVVIFSAITFIHGISRRTFLTILVGTIVLLPVMWTHMKDYQKGRILSMINPSTDALGAGYHTRQSKIAIGNGGFFGKGIFKGTQSKLNFLPEKHTDFIFAVYAEEVGFIGVFFLLLLYFSLVMRMVDLIIKAKDRIGVFIAAGVSVMFAFHFLYNVSMTIGLMPIVGIPLPLFSYGGSSLITNYAAVGLLISIRARRFRND
jgi:rod shape determining protein RodA